MTTALLKSKHASLADAAKPIPRAWVARVFERLSAQLGAKMADLYAGTEASTVQAEWAVGLAGFQDVEIARGIAACRERAFAPTLSEFLRLCRPALDPEWAWHEAGDGLRQRDAGHVGDWSHPAVWRAACAMGNEVRGGDYSRHRTRWAYVLKREFAAGWGDGVPPPARRIEHNPILRGPTAAERVALAKLRAMRFPRGAEQEEQGEATCH